MPARLRPTAPFAADAVLVGDPGRALLLAQELLEKPKMSNHARGLWGYSGRTPGGAELSVQSTGMGGPSAALVLADLAELGLRRAIRVGTCAALGDGVRLGELIVVGEALTWPRPGSGDGVARPDPELSAALAAALGDGAGTGTVASLDTLPGNGTDGDAPADVADMQTATLLARGAELGVALAAVLIVATTIAGEHLGDEAAEAAAKRAGSAAAAVLSG
jgi:uridine phosphorylase